MEALPWCLGLGSKMCGYKIHFRGSCCRFHIMGLIYKNMLNIEWLAFVINILFIFYKHFHIFHFSSFRWSFFKQCFYPTHSEPKTKRRKWSDLPSLGKLPIENATHKNKEIINMIQQSRSRTNSLGCYNYVHTRTSESLVLFIYIF